MLHAIRTGEDRSPDAAPDLIADVLAQAADTARRLAGHAVESAGAFRAGRLEQAHAALQEFTGGAGLLLTTIEAVAIARGTTVDQLAWNGATLAAHARSLMRPLTAVIEAHESRDWLTVADVLEFDVQATLEHWPAMFEGLAQPHAGA